MCEVSSTCFSDGGSDLGFGMDALVEFGGDKSGRDSRGWEDVDMSWVVPLIG